VDAELPYLATLKRSWFAAIARRFCASQLVAKQG